MPTAVLTGCNSGIGYEWAKILLKEGYKLYALDATDGEKLQSLKGSKCTTAQVDVTSVESIEKFKQSIGDEPVDLLLNIAGIMIDPEHDSRETTNLQIIEKQFKVNTYGPVLLTQALTPNLLAAPAPRRLGVVSSRVGSIADNTSGGYYGYRASKTAVNSFFKSFAVDLKEHEVIVFMLHPGFTKTNLSEMIWKIPGVVEPEVAAEGLWKIVKGKGMEDTGKFWHREGMELPW
ncbi:short-chain alcohol dehydrogenase-like protein [Neohortaea acidophila]|uniref:Short-chain alcohol dehydrogenase-like protein n=1 Tax=Neohortaea acidophila TaxID=245834 RepID=A0A6A6PWY7_9PEZI|nr:short-chain alcohol dehydrogenase-like protein [Neohortaea acidophila]KAF2484688.1 short-chain alcohol dehydrogenase-like protein [Neohortaea acidophila]